MHYSPIYILPIAIVLWSSFYQKAFRKHIYHGSKAFLQIASPFFQYQLHKYVVSHGASLLGQMVKNLPVMQEIQVQSLGWEDHLKKDMATHSSILAWRIPWMKDPGELQSMGLQRVGHDWATKRTHAHTHIHTHFFFFFYLKASGI